MVLKWTTMACLGVAGLLAVPMAGLAQTSKVEINTLNGGASRDRSQDLYDFGDKQVYPKPDDYKQDVLVRNTDQKNNYLVRTFPVYNTDAIEIQCYLLRSASFEQAVVEVMGAKDVKDASGRSVQFLVVTAPDFMMPGIAQTIETCDVRGFRFFDGTGNTNSAGVAGAIAYVGKHRTASQLAAILSGTELGNIGVFLFPPFADNSLNTIYIVDNPTDIADNLLALEAFDKPPLQVNIKVKIYEMDEGDGATLGLDWSAWKRAVSGNFNYTFLNSMDATAIKDYGALIDLNAAVLTEFLNYLADSGKAEVLTETSITATNDFDPSDPSGQPGRVARVFSGSTIPFITPASATADPAVSPQRLDVTDGVELLITPYVASETVSLDTAVTVNSLLGYVPETHYPIVSSQETATFNTVAFGETIVIGGLTRTAKVTHDTGVPLLKDIPILGYLFKKETTTDRVTKLIITLTPTLKDPASSDASIAME